MLVSVYKNRLPSAETLGRSQSLDKWLLDLLWWIKYRNHCKFLMLVRAYNNFNKENGKIMIDFKPYSFFTKQQAAEFLWVSVRTIENITIELEKRWYLLIHRKKHRNPFNHVNFYLYTVPVQIEEEKDIHIEEIVIEPPEQVKIEVEVYTPAEWKLDRDMTCFDSERAFYERIRDEWTKLEVSDTKNVFKITRNNWFFDIASNQVDTYFVWGVDPKKQWRCKDTDIVRKKYFALDIDIRKTIKDRTGEIISDNQMYWYIDEILKLLDESDFGDYDEVVCSWNGVHIYYIGTPRCIDKDIYSVAVRKIFSHIDEVIAPLWLKTDKAVSNIASLFRCPATANYWRMSKYGIDFWQAFVYKRQEWWWITYDSLESIAAQELSEQQHRENKRKIEKIKIARKFPKKDGDMFEKINSLPVDVIFSSYTWLELQSDGKNFKSNKDWKNIGCFYNKDKNIIINTWTHYLTTDERSYSTFDFVLKEVLCLSNTKDDLKTTIEYFKNNYNI